jgi:hypothetical protein
MIRLHLTAKEAGKYSLTVCSGRRGEHRFWMPRERTTRICPGLSDGWCFLCVGKPTFSCSQVLLTMILGRDTSCTHSLVHSGLNDFLFLPLVDSPSLAILCPFPFPLAIPCSAQRNLFSCSGIPGQSETLFI